MAIVCIGGYLGLKGTRLSSVEDKDIHDVVIKRWLNEEDCVNYQGRVTMENFIKAFKEYRETDVKGLEKDYESKFTY